MRYFKKELLSNPLFLPSGARVPFELTGSNTGLLATEDAGLLSELDKAMKRGVGGVSEVTEQQYQDLKKNPPVRRSSTVEFRAQLRDPLPAVPPGKNHGVAAANQAQSAPLIVPETIPLTAKVKDMKATRSRKGTVVGDIMASTLTGQAA